MRMVGRIFGILASYLAACYGAGAAFIAVLFNPVSAASEGVAWLDAVGTRT